MDALALPTAGTAFTELTAVPDNLLPRLARKVGPEGGRFERLFSVRLETMGFGLRERRALARLTLGAAARMLQGGRPVSHFVEDVQYHGRRLAKLNVPPQRIPAVLAEYDRLLLGRWTRGLPQEDEALAQWRERVEAGVLLTVNNAYYQVREAESQAFFEMFWAELQSSSLQELLARFLAVLARFARADRAHLFLVDPTDSRLHRRASYREGETEAIAGRSLRAVPLAAHAEAFCTETARAAAGAVLDSGWGRRTPTCWSVPMVSGSKLIGVLQFGFARPYEWLPREQQLLSVAAERCRMAIDKARLLEHLRAQETQIRRLAEGMMHVEEAERRRISRELHDQTGQDLLWIRLQMELLERELPEGQRSWQSRLGEIRDMTERTIVEIRRLIAALSPAVLEQLGLAPAIRQLAARFRQRYPCRIHLRIRRLERLPHKMEVVLYRLVQECLNNIAKHSGCKTVNISLELTDGKVRLSVSDDGVGFRVEEALNKPGSFGLAGLRERVALLGGWCAIESRPAGSVDSEVRAGAQGRRRSASTTIRIELPLSSGSGGDRQPQVGDATESPRILRRRFEREGGRSRGSEPALEPRPA